MRALLLLALVSCGPPLPPVESDALPLRVPSLLPADRATTQVRADSVEVVRVHCQCAAILTVRVPGDTTERLAFRCLVPASGQRSTEAAAGEAP